VKYTIAGNVLCGANVERCEIEPLPVQLGGTVVMPLGTMRIRTAGGGEVVGLLVSVENEAAPLQPGGRRRVVVYYDRALRELRAAWVEVRL
jgi:hypothetical protein